MKTIIVMVVTVLATASVVVAQHRHGGRHKDPQKIAEHQTEKMKSVLSLDEKQYAAVKNINDFYASKFMRLRSDSTSDKITKRAEMQNLRTQKEKEIAGVLTPEQQTKWSSFKTEEKNKHHGRHGNRNKQLSKVLSLSDDQQKKMDAASASFREEMHGIKADTTLQKEAKQKKFDDLKAKHESEVKSILSTEQYGKWQAYQAGKQSRRHRR